METSRTFNEKIRFFTEELQKAKKEERYNDLLDVILEALDSVACKGPYETETIHALSLALAKLPNEALAKLAEKLRTRIKQFSGELEDLVERKLVHFSKINAESASIRLVINIDCLIFISRFLQFLYNFPKTLGLLGWL